MIMSRVVKYYYSTPVYFADLANNPLKDKIVVNHIRHGKRFTMAMIYDDETSSIRFGIATCMPVDNFDKKIGRTIAEKNAMEKPFHIITDFTGRRNDFADRAMEICISKEKELLMRDYPWIFNENNFID
jgi:hypothetical protein